MIYKIRNLKSQQATPIPESVLTVGRDEASDIPIEDESVSRNHARIFNEADGLFVEDAGSSNGTFVRNQPIRERTKVEIGDMIGFGMVQFRLDPEVPGEVTTPKKNPNIKPALRPSLKRPTAKLASSDDRNRTTGPLETAASAVLQPKLVAYKPGSVTAVPMPSATPVPVSAPTVALMDNGRLLLSLGMGTGMALGLILGLLLQKFVLGR